MGQGIYSQEQGERTYQALVETARRVLQDGHSVVVDAACLQRVQRDLFRNLGRELGVPFQIVSIEAPLEVLRRRIRLRQKQARDASEADLAVLDHQLKTQQEIGSDEADVLTVASEDRRETSNFFDGGKQVQTG